MSLDALHNLPQLQEKDNFQFYLDKHALELTPDGKFIRWSTKNSRHPRHWSILKKIYNSLLIVWLDFFTYLLLQWHNLLLLHFHIANILYRTAISTAGVRSTMSYLYFEADKRFSERSRRWRPKGIWYFKIIVYFSFCFSVRLNPVYSYFATS